MTDRERAAALLPCPFCGSTSAEIRSNRIGDFFVICCGEENDTSCGASTGDRRCETEKGAVDRWNYRALAAQDAAAPDQPAEVREVEIDALRLRAFETNSDADRQAYFDAVSKWFQDRHYRGSPVRPTVGETWETDAVEFEIWQDDDVVARVSGPITDATREAAHYAMVYGQDGPVDVMRVIRIPVVLAANEEATHADR